MKDKTSLDTEHKSFFKTRWFMILSLIFFAPLGIFLFWRYGPRSKVLKIFVTLAFAFYFFFYSIFCCALVLVIAEGDVQQTSSSQAAISSSLSKSARAPNPISFNAPKKIDGSSEAKSEPQVSDQSSSSAISSIAEQSSSSSSESKIESSSSAVSSEPSKPEQSSSPAIVSSSSSASQETSRTIDITSEEAKQENVSYVWVTETGKKYHSSPSCGNIKHASEVTLQQAQSMGLTPCSKCY